MTPAELEALRIARDEARQRLDDAKAKVDDLLPLERAANDAGNAYYKAEERERAARITERIIGCTIVAVKPYYGESAPTGRGEYLEGAVLVLSNGVEISPEGDDSGCEFWVRSPRDGAES